MMPNRDAAPRGTARRLHVLTWGCQMNVYDSERMSDALAPLGFAAVAEPDGADMVILNTCHIRERATEKVFSELGRLRRLKEARAQAGARMVLVLAGCVAQAEGEEILARAPFVDIVLGPQSYHRLPGLLARVEAGEAGVIETEFDDDKFAALPAPRRLSPVSAFLTIQEGCDKFCSFCVVPYTRGAEHSRPAAAILAEARARLAAGAREIVLLGQNVNAWHGAAPDGGDWRLGRLIRALAELPGLDRLRYTTSHPRDMDGDLIAAHAEVPTLVPFLHLPVQSGSDRILAAMNRRHRADDYLRLIERIRAARADIALSSDFIVGYPGETEDDFAATLALVERVGFAQAYSFRFSPRPGTPAAEVQRADMVDDAVAETRLHALQAVLRRQQAAFNTATAGRVLPVLFTGPGRHPGQIGGRTPYLQPVHLNGPTALVGQTRMVSITAANPNSLSGILVPDAEERACA